MGFKTFFDNIRYLARYNLKQMHAEIDSLNGDGICDIAQKIMNDTKADFDKIFIPDVRSTLETVEELAKTQKSIIRFGDGEFETIAGRSIPFQNYDKNLAEKYKEILCANDENLMIGIGYEYYHCPINAHQHVKKFLYHWAGKKIAFINKYLSPDKTYYSTMISQVYAAYQEYDFNRHFDLLRQIWQDKKICIITGDRVFNKIKHNVFDNAKDIKWIYGPTKHAFEKYENLKEEIFKIEKDRLLIFVIGPAGKILAYDTYKAGYRALDIGHVVKDYDYYKKNIKMTTEEIFKYFAPD